MFPSPMRMSPVGTSYVGVGSAPIVQMVAPVAPMPTSSFAMPVAPMPTSNLVMPMAPMPTSTLAMPMVPMPTSTLAMSAPYYGSMGHKQRLKHGRPWASLTTREQIDLMHFAWTAESWDTNAPNKCWDHAKWNNLTPSQKIAAEHLGLTPATWEEIPVPVDDFSPVAKTLVPTGGAVSEDALILREQNWLERPWTSLDYQSTNLRELGFRDKNWNREDMPNPIWLFTPFANLQPHEQLAAVRLGYNAKSWDSIQEKRKNDMLRKPEAERQRSQSSVSIAESIGSTSSRLRRRTDMDIETLDPLPTFTILDPQKVEKLEEDRMMQKDLRGIIDKQEDDLAKDAQSSRFRESVFKRVGL